MGVKIRQKTKGGPWWVFLNHQGKRKSKCVGDKQTAEAVAKELRKRIAKGDFGLTEKEPLTFQAYADKWITTTVPATCKPSTASDYEGLLKNHILPVLGCKKVTEITRLMVRDFLMSKINNGLNASTAAHMRNVISGVLNLAVDDEIISVNLAHRIGKISKTEKMNRAIDPLTSEELSLLLETFRKNYSRQYPLALTLARTGMRIGEALALQWGDIDFNGRFITIKRGFSRGRVEAPKNGKMRKVDMSKQLTETLSALNHQRKREALAKGWGEVPLWVFISTEGTPLNKDNWKKRVFDKALIKAKLRKIRVHDLRHTYATLRLSKGDNITDVSNQLGHHSVKLTLDIYNHWLPGKKKSEVDALDDLHPSAPYTHPTEKKELAEMANSLI